MNINHTIPDPRAKLGDQFTYRSGKSLRPATITGYHIEVDTDTGRVSVTYRGTYDLAGQLVTVTVPRSIVDFQLIRKEGTTPDTP